ncbi:hypothetical protein [Mycoplasma sp. HF14]
MILKISLNIHNPKYALEPSTVATSVKTYNKTYKKLDDTINEVNNAREIEIA